MIRKKSECLLQTGHNLFFVFYQRFKIKNKNLKVFYLTIKLLITYPSRNLPLWLAAVFTASCPRCTPSCSDPLHKFSLHSQLCRPTSQILAALLAVQTQFTNSRCTPSCSDPLHKFSPHSQLFRPTSQILAALLAVQTHFTNSRCFPSCTDAVHKFPDSSAKCKYF